MQLLRILQLFGCGASGRFSLFLSFLTVALTCSNVFGQGNSNGPEVRGPEDFIGQVRCYTENGLVDVGMHCFAPSVGECASEIQTCTRQDEEAHCVDSIVYLPVGTICRPSQGCNQYSCDGEGACLTVPTGCQRREEECFVFSTDASAPDCCMRVPKPPVDCVLGEWVPPPVCGVEVQQTRSVLEPARCGGDCGAQVRRITIPCEPTATPTLVTQTATPTSEPTPLLTYTPTQTPLGPPATATLTPTGTVTPAMSLTPEVTSEPTVVASPTPPLTPTPTPTPTISPSHTWTPTAAPTQVPTLTSSPSPSVTPPLPTPNSTVTHTNTATAVATSTPVGTQTPTSIPTSTFTPLPTATSTVVPTSTNAPQLSATATYTPTAPPWYDPSCNSGVDYCSQTVNPLCLSGEPLTEPPYQVCGTGAWSPPHLANRPLNNFKAACGPAPAMTGQECVIERSVHGIICKPDKCPNPTRVDAICVLAINGTEFAPSTGCDNSCGPQQISCPGVPGGCCPDTDQCYSGTLPASGGGTSMCCPSGQAPCPHPSSPGYYCCSPGTPTPPDNQAGPMD